MPRLRSQTRITGVLPRELLQRSLEFLPVREVYCEAQLISSEFLSASRRALTRGRWRPMALFSKEAEEHRNRFEYGADLSSWHETFKEVWALEPGEVFFELAYWDSYRYAALRAGQFLKIVEPNIEGLSRIVAACELAQEAYDGDNGIVRLVARAHYCCPRHASAATVDRGTLARLPARRDRRAMDREEATHKKARLAPPPTKQGWLHKKGGTALSAERKRWFVLQGAGSEATLRYSKEVNSGHRGTIRCEQIRGVVQDDNTLDIYTPDRTYHVRASSEQSAGQWATVIRCAAAGAEEVESSSSDEEEENTGIPWMIDGAWVDQRAPAPLRTVAALGSVPDGEHAAHVRLADGSTLTADVTAGEQVEVATAGSSTLVAALEDTTPPQPPSILGTACASVALGLVGSAFVPRAATAGLLLAGAAAASVKRKRDAPQKRYDLVLTTRLNPDEEQPLRKRRRSGELLARRPSLVGIRSPNPQQRRPSLFSPQKAKCPDFSGTYVLDHGASDSNDEMMAALGVPWVARRAIRGTKRTIHIEHDGDVWDETTVTKFRTMEDHFDLSGGSLVKISPVDKSSYTTTTTIQSGAIVTAVDFGVPNKSQVITRRLDGKRYVVLNELSLKGRVLKVRSVFNRVDDRVVGG